VTRSLDLLSGAISPAEAVEVLGKRGVKVSERTVLSDLLIPA